MTRLKLGVLISGRGSNLQALIDAAADPAYPAEIVLVISNRPEAPGLERAARAGIEHRVIADPSRQGFAAAADAALRKSHVALVALAGYMRILDSGFVAAWRDRLINIHPSLLPAFPGLHAQRQALEAGVRFSGCTVHFVRDAVDTGPIIAQAVVPVRGDDDEDQSVPAHLAGRASALSAGGTAVRRRPAACDRQHGRDCRRVNTGGCDAQPVGRVCPAGRLGYTLLAQSQLARGRMSVADPELERHRRTWIGFTRFMKISLVVIVLILIGMALSLL